MASVPGEVSTGFNLPPAPAAWMNEVSQGHGKVESKERFLLFHTPGYCDESYH